MKSRNKRTVFLGIAATATFVWAAIYQFDVPAQELAWLLLYCVIGVVAVALVAAVAMGVVILLRSLWRRLNGVNDQPGEEPWSGSR